VYLPGDVSILPDYKGAMLLFVALPGEPPHTERLATKCELRLPSPWNGATRLTERLSGASFERGENGAFRD